MQPLIRPSSLLPTATVLPDFFRKLMHAQELFYEMYEKKYKRLKFAGLSPNFFVAFKTISERVQNFLLDFFTQKTLGS